jgi:hypothetical protein
MITFALMTPLGTGLRLLLLSSYYTEITAVVIRIVVPHSSIIFESSLKGHKFNILKFHDCP